MVYLTIDTSTPEGKKVFESIKKNKYVKVLKPPNEETKKALRDAKKDIGVKEIKNFSEWLNKIWSE